jgi:hypothetical protein
MRFQKMVMAGLVPATPIIGHGHVIGVAGTSPAMTPCYEMASPRIDFVR